MRRFGTNLLNHSKYPEDSNLDKRLLQQQKLQQKNIREASADGNLQGIIEGVLRVAETQFVSKGDSTSDEKSVRRNLVSFSPSSPTSTDSHSSKSIRNNETCCTFRGNDPKSWVLFTEIGDNKRKQVIIYS